MSVRREVARLAGYAVVNSLLQTAVFLVDRIMLGRRGPQDLAAGHIAGNLEWSLFMVTSAFTVGTLARVGMTMGAGQRGASRDATIVSLAFAAVVGVGVAIVGVALLGWLHVGFPQASPAALEGARGYLTATFAAAPAMLVALATTSALQGSGDTRTPLVAALAANVVHVGLNRVLILGAFGFEGRGAAGAGISTAATFVLECGVLILALRRRGGLVGPGPIAWPAGAAGEVRAMARIASPAVLERVLLHAGFLAYTEIIGLLGDTAMAAQQALISAEAICFTTADGFGVAAAAIVAKKIGEGAPREARRAASVAVLAAVVAVSSLGGAIYLLRAQVMAVFTRDPAVAAMGASVFPVLALAQPFMAASIVLGQAARGAGATRAALAASFVGSLLVRVPACFWLGVHAGLGLFGVWIGSSLDWASRAIVLAAVAFWQGDRLLGAASARFRAEHAAPGPPLA